jgi:hypothetical protein
MGARFTAALATLAVAACGRLGFDGHTGSPEPGGGAAPDADNGMYGGSPATVDAGAVPSDTAPPPGDVKAPPADARGAGVDAPSECAQPAPFLHLITVVASNNGNTQTALYCSAGLSGTLDATIRRSGSGKSKFAEVTGPIVASGQAVFDLGGADCLGCFVRLEAGGLEDNGPITDFVGQ